MTNNCRFIWADSLKGILIIFVVLGHAIQEVLKQGCFDNHFFNLIYSFHMPAFMAISGWVCYRGRNGDSSRFEILGRRFRQLMIPFIIWALIRLAVNPPYNIESFFNIFLYPDGSFWFLWVLFFITVFFLLGDWVSECLGIKQEWIIGAICIFFVTLMVFINIRILGVQFISYYFLFYSCGFYLHKYNDIVTKKIFPLLFLFVVWAMLAWEWNMHELPVFLQAIRLPQSIMLYSYRFVTALVAIYVLFGFSSKYLNVKERWNSPMIQIGTISLGIYTSHILIMPFSVELVSLLFSDNNLIILLAFVVSLTVSWALVYVLSKWKVTSMLLLGKL